MSKLALALRASLLMLAIEAMVGCASSEGSGTCNPALCSSGRCEAGRCVTGDGGGVDARTDTSTVCRAATPTPRNMDGRAQPAFAMCGQCTSQTAGTFEACDPVRSSSCSYTGNNAVGMPRCLCGQNDQCAPGLRCATSGNTFVCIGGDASVPDGGVVNNNGTLCGSVQCRTTNLMLGIPPSADLGESCCNVNGVPTCVANSPTNCGCGVSCGGTQTCVAGALGALTGGLGGVNLGGSICCGMPFSLGGLITVPVAFCTPEFPSIGGDGGFGIPGFDGGF